jgi:hypothetical protein
VSGAPERRSLPAPSTTASTSGGFEVNLEAAKSRPGEETELAFSVRRNGQRIETEPYLGAGGHLVALREGDLAYLHVHPSEHGEGGRIRFETEFPSAASYRLFLQFKHEGRVETAAFTRAVGP